jgi:hypothetical protein
MIYASDPDAAPDSDFIASELRHLVAGNRGRLLDARRTPITIVAVRPERGSFELEVGAFEDAGARWELPLEDVSRLQFARDAAAASFESVTELEQASARFGRELAIDCDPATRLLTLQRIAREREALRRQLDIEWLDVDRHVIDRRGDPRLFALVEKILAARGLALVDERFTAAFVSNPNSGELVKGHAIVLAELGLCPYRGRVVRDADLFEAPWSKAERARHLIVRIAFMQELFAGLGREEVTLYRGAAVEGPLPERSPASFTSATFSRAVGAEHFEGGPRTRTAVIWRQVVPISRLFMTFLETRAMNDRFHEAEAVLIADPGNRAF